MLSLFPCLVDVISVLGRDIVACASSPQCALLFSPLIEQDPEALILAAGTQIVGAPIPPRRLCVPLPPFLGSRVVGEFHLVPGLW